MLQRFEEGFGCDLMEDDTTGLLGLQSQSLAQMPSDSLPFTVFIGS